MVLLLNDGTSSVDDIASILYKLLAFWRELGSVKWCGVKNVLQSLVDLRVVGHTTLSESLDDTVELDLNVDREFRGRSEREKIEEKTRTFLATSASFSALFTWKKAKIDESWT